MLFEREGTPVFCGANQPLRLDASDEVWYVARDRVDLFLTPVLEDGSHGPRRHVTSVAAGAAFLSLDCSAHAAGEIIIASGTAATELSRVPMARFRELAEHPDSADAVAGIISEWAVTLSGAAWRGNLPRHYREVPPGTELGLETGELAMPRRDVVWITPSGSVSFLGGVPLAEGALFPLTARTWVEAKSSASLTVREPDAWLSSPDRWSALSNFHDVVIAAIVRRIQYDKEKEALRLERKRIADQHAAHSAVLNLASVLTPEEAELLAGAEDDDAVMTVCRLVGSAAGMTVVPPPPSIRLGKQKDPVASIARASRLRIRRVALRDQWWRGDHGPLLAFADSDRRPIALLPEGSQHYRMVDPTLHTSSDVTPEVAASLESFAYVFYRPLAEDAISGREVLRFAGFGSAHDVERFLWVGLAGGLLSLLLPIITARIFSQVIPGADRVSLAQFVVGLAVAALTMSMFQITRDIAILRLEGKVDGQLQAAIWDRVLSLPVPFFRNYSAGDLSQRAMAVNSIREILSNYVVGAVTGGMFSIFSFALLFWYDWRLALVASVVVLIAVAVTLSSSVLQLRHQRPQYEIQGALSGLVFQFITGIAKLRVAGAETRAFTYWTKRFSEQKKLAKRSRDLSSWVSAANSVFPLLASGAVFWWIAFEAESILNLGDFTAFNAALASFLASMLGMSSSLVSAIGVIPIWERARPVLQALPEANTAKSDPGELSGAVEAGHLSFRYAPDAPLVLTDVSFHANPGEFVAMVGASGSGKSTLLRLLLGFEAPEAGGIYYDRQDLSGLDVRAVRRQIGVVLQSGQLMPGDIFTNIVGASSLTLQDAERAAEMAGLDEDIKNMPMGMHTVISEGTSGISGGQKQRLMIARAIVGKPRILLFDEATSALDNSTQAIVSRSLETLNATRIVIAHRLSTIIRADRIYVFDRGRVVQTGTYDELIGQEGLFAELARRQML